MLVPIKDLIMFSGGWKCLNWNEKFIFFSLIFCRDDPVPPCLTGDGTPTHPHQPFHWPPPAAGLGQDEARTGTSAPVADPALPATAAAASTGARKADTGPHQGITDINAVVDPFDLYERDPGFEPCLQQTYVVQTSVMIWIDSTENVWQQLQMADSHGSWKLIPWTSRLIDKGHFYTHPTALTGRTQRDLARFYLLIGKNICHFRPHCQWAKFMLAEIFNRNTTPFGQI